MDLDSRLQKSFFFSLIGGVFRPEVQHTEAYREKGPQKSGSKIQFNMPVSYILLHFFY